VSTPGHSWAGPGADADICGRPDLAHLCGCSRVLHRDRPGCSPGTLRVLSGYSPGTLRVLDKHRGAPRAIDGKSTVGMGCLLLGYSGVRWGTLGYTRGTHGVLKGCSGRTGGVRRRLERDDDGHALARGRERVAQQHRRLRALQPRRETRCAGAQGMPRAASRRQ
jgi:hypothetical protein